jgi:hypothetical protein
MKPLSSSRQIRGRLGDGPSGPILDFADDRNAIRFTAKSIHGQQNQMFELAQ